jgi:hypothetical protein
MRKHHIELPSAVAVARSEGVLTKKRGDLAEGDGVKRRRMWLTGGACEGVV